MSLQKILSKTEEYLEVPAVVGHEQLFMDHLADDFTLPGYDIEKGDGIIVVHKNGSKSPKIVTAHIDRHGIVVNDKGEFEYAAFNAKKHYGDEIKDSKSLFEKVGERFRRESVRAHDANGRVIGNGKVRGFGYDFEVKDLLFDIRGMGGLPSGTSVSYGPSLDIWGGEVSGQIDNVISVAVARQLVDDGFDGTLLFATEEEIGRSWEHLAHYLESRGKPSQEIITLDTTPYEDSRAIAEGLVVLRNKDSKGEFNPGLVQRLRDICEDRGIRYEMKDEVIEARNALLIDGSRPKGLGITELGRIVEHTDGKFNGATVQLPSTGYHTNHETTSELALNNYYEALKVLL